MDLQECQALLRNAAASTTTPSSCLGAKRGKAGAQPPGSKESPAAWANKSTSRKKANILSKVRVWGRPEGLELSARWREKDWPI